MGYVVHRFKDLKQKDFESMISGFAAKTINKSKVVFYYVGHGCDAERKDGSRGNYVSDVCLVGLVFFLGAEH